MADKDVRPSYADVMEHLEGLSARAEVTMEEIGRSVQGRGIAAATFTAPEVPDDDKQRVLIVASQHGAEESGRAMAMAAMDFLAGGGEEAAEVLRRQAVTFVPCGNPDGAVADTNANAEGADIAHTYSFDAPAATPEGRALEELAGRLAPEVCVDIHGRAGGGMKELAWLQPGWGFSSDRYFLTAMSLAMAEAGEAAGFPQCELTPAGLLVPAPGHRSLIGAILAYRYKTLGLGLESIEHYYRHDDWRATGQVRLRRLLAFGNADAFGLGAEGYPNALVSGNRVCALMAHGATAAERRASRVELLTFLKHNFAIVDRGPDGVERCCRVRVASNTCEGPNPPRFAVLVRIKDPCTIHGVSWQGRELPPGDGPHGWRSWQDRCSTLVLASIAAPFGGPQRDLVVEYDCPYWLGPKTCGDDTPPR